MAWVSASRLDIPTTEINEETIERMQKQVVSIDVNKLSVDELKQFFEFSRRLLNSKILTNDDRSKAKKTSQPKDTSHSENQPNARTDGIEESYYIQTIQELNREIAQNVYNKTFTDENDGHAAVGGGAGVDDSSQSLGIDTKRDLLYKIHIKNKYIKRLLCEHGALIETNNRQRDELLMLNVSLKQSAHRLAETLAELLEQKKQNRTSADDIARLHKKISDVRRQMSRIEQDKRQYKIDIVGLGDEIQKKIDQWNDMLQSKYANISGAGGESARVQSIDLAAAPYDIDCSVDNDIYRREIEALSKAVKKRNAIIAEMEVLLTGLTNEISSSAVVINRIVKNLSQKEHNFADNLEKLHKHLERIVAKAPSDSGDSGPRKSRKGKVKRPSQEDSDGKVTNSSKNKANNRNGKK